MTKKEEVKKLLKKAMQRKDLCCVIFEGIVQNQVFDYIAKVNNKTFVMRDSTYELDSVDSIYHMKCIY